MIFFSCLHHQRLCVSCICSKMWKKVEKPLVCVSAEGHWSADEDAVLTYTIQEILLPGPRTGLATTRSHSEACKQIDRGNGTD